MKALSQDSHVRFQKSGGLINMDPPTNGSSFKEVHEKAPTPPVLKNSSIYKICMMGSSAFCNELEHLAIQCIVR